MGRPSVHTFLSTAKKALSGPSGQHAGPLTLVVGNESADLDSLCSAILFAYLRTHHSPPPYRLHIPIANLPRADLALRPEFAAVLRRAGLCTEDVPTLSDLLPPSSKDPGLDGKDSPCLFLVDHNALTGPLAERGLGERVVGCVDHHADEAKVPRDAEPRVIERCGSTASLVVREGREAWEAATAAEGEGEEGGKDVDVELAWLALAPILVDTVALKANEKTTPTDVQAAEFVERFLFRQPRDGDAEVEVEGGGYDRRRFHAELVRIKDDLTGMGYRDILRKDYKKWEEAGMALGVSMVMSRFEFLLAKIGDQPKFLSELRKWAEEQELDIAAVMTGAVGSDGKFARQLLVWALNPKAVQVAKKFVERDHENLGLQTWGGSELDHVGDEEWRQCWKQTRTENSRKQIAPMLRAAMKEGSKL